MTSANGLVALFGGYLHQDWPDEYPDVWEAVEAFLEESPPAARGGLLTDVTGVIALDLTEVDLRRIMIYDLGAGYDPGGDGLTYSEWLTRLRTMLES
jgi:hypothetical protein